MSFESSNIKLAIGPLLSYVLIYLYRKINEGGIFCQLPIQPSVYTHSRCFYNVRGSVSSVKNLFIVLSASHL